MGAQCLNQWRLFKSNCDDTITLDKFLDYFAKVTHWDVEMESLEDGNFKRYPAFGLATDCCTVKGYAAHGVAA
tara:strand:- start:326 stop:544 length:219 start_codon:yes stop_codon:yes gene_type:complete